MAQTRRRRPPKKKTPEFSKIVLVLVMLAFFAGVIVGGIVVWKNPDQLSAWLMFLGAPTATAIGFYAWKAKAENIAKFKKEGVTVEDSDIPV